MRKILPWVLVVGLSVLTIVQQQTINSLEHQQSEIASEENSKSANSLRRTGPSKSSKVHNPSNRIENTRKTWIPKSQQREGFGSSDHYEYDRRIQESIAFERKFLQAENELVQINKLTESPKNETVRKYMTMNEKLKEGMVA